MATTLTDPDWSITAEQFLASMLTSHHITEFFSRRVNICEELASLKNRRFSRANPVLNV